jgi:transcriptional regulator with XRE-family HTH domain
MAKSPMTIEEAAEHHGRVIKYYRRSVINPPDGWTQEQLAEAMNISVRWVQEMERMSFIQSVSRRKALVAILGIPAALLNLEEAVKISDSASTHIQTWLLDSLEDVTNTRWQLYYTSGNSITEEGLLNQIERLEQIADEGLKDQNRIYRILIQNYQLAGSLARDNFHYSNAKKYFREAQRLAQDAQSPDLIATSVSRYAVALLRQERIEEALTMYRGAADLAARTQPQVRAYILSGLAEVLARTNQRTECYKTLDLAEKLLDRAKVVSPVEDFAHVRLTLQSLEDSRGECYVLLGEPLKGLNYLRTAQKLLDPTMNRNRCRLLMQQSEAFLAAGHPDQCVRYALKGLQLAQALESTSNVNWAHEIHVKLLRSKWRGEPIVGELGAALIS